MSATRSQSEKTVVAIYAADGTREVWHLRFNRGTKQNNPVKFFAALTWKAGAGGVDYAGTRWDATSEREAEASFAAAIAQDGGVLEPSSPQLMKKLVEMGYAI